MMNSRFTGVRNVFLDIDDTLWENNLFFMQSLDWLCREGRAHGHCDRATAAVLNHRETFNIPHLGYGYDSYERSLVMALRTLVARSGSGTRHGAMLRQALNWTKFLRTHPIVWREGVANTLPELARRFRTVIVTKGHDGDQRAKVIRCGLETLFHGVEVVPHKNPDDYLRVLAKYEFDAAETVMIGNSPRSDINMAKRAGLRTIYVPHPQTWFREMEPIDPAGPPTIEVKKFDQVLMVLQESGAEE